MSQYFSIHPVNPQVRLIKRAVEMIGQGALIIYPTDSCYALGCHIGDKNALDRIRRLRQVVVRHVSGFVEPRRTGRRRVDVASTWDTL